MLISKVIVASRFDVVRYMHDIKGGSLDKLSGPFVLISCYGNTHNHISDNPKLELIPQVLIKNEHNEKLLRDRGMVDYLNVFCDDITKEEFDSVHETEPGEYILKLFDEQNAQDVVEFVLKYARIDLSLVVHCTAGVSRSGAIGTWACHILGIDIATLPNYIDPNPYMLNMLMNYK